jgi:hypothetical protein
VLISPTPFPKEGAEKTMHDRNTAASAARFMTLAGLLMSLPGPILSMEENMPITEKQVTLVVNGTSAPAVVTSPEEYVAAWGIVLVPGSFMNDIDGDYLAERQSVLASRAYRTWPPAGGCGCAVCATPGRRHGRR